MKKTNKKVRIKNGRTYIERAVYVSESGLEYFKYGGNFRLIYQRKNGTYNAPFFNGVEYI